MSDTWIEASCEKCDANNWICLGDLSDLTSSDDEGFICHSCGHKQFMPEMLMEDLMMIHDVETEEELLQAISYADGFETAGKWNTSFKNKKSKKASKKKK